MSAFRLSRFFSQPEILREIDPENLLSLLADHAASLAAFGLVLPALRHAEEKLRVLMDREVLRDNK